MVVIIFITTWSGWRFYADLKELFMVEMQMAGLLILFQTSLLTSLRPAWILVGVTMTGSVFAE